MRSLRNFGRGEEVYGVGLKGYFYPAKGKKEVRVGVGMVGDHTSMVKLVSGLFFYYWRLKLSWQPWQAIASTCSTEYLPVDSSISVKKSNSHLMCLIF